MNVPLAYAGIVQLVGAIISLSVCYVSFKGFKIIGSPTLARLALSFLLLGSGLLIESLRSFLPQLIGLVTLLLLIAVTLQTIGYFFLAFSHAIDVLSLQKISIVPVVAITPISAIFTMRALSFYFLIYGAVETFLSYSKLKRKDTMLVGVGLSVIALGELVGWLSYFYPPNNILALTSAVLKVFGFSTLFLPVAKFSMLRGEKLHAL